MSEILQIRMGQWHGKKHKISAIWAALFMIWVCLKMVSTPKPSLVLLIIIHHYPVSKWLFHWEYTQHFQTNPFGGYPMYPMIWPKLKGPSLVSPIAEQFKGHRESKNMGHLRTGKPILIIAGIGKCPILGLLDITWKSSHKKYHMPNGWVMFNGDI